MPLETAIYIDTLQPDWPLGTDPESQGDDHLRMIKQVLQSTFPALDGALTGAPTNFNNLTDGFTYAAAGTAPDMAHWTAWQPGGIDAGHVAVMVAGTPTVDYAKTNNGAVLTYSSLMNLIYPVGTVLVRSHSDNPAAYLGFGTWVQRTGSIYGVGSVTDSAGLNWNIPLGVVTGNWRVQNSMIAASTINLVMNAVANHTHTYSLRDGANPSSATQPDNGGHNYGTGTTSASGGHTPSGKVTIGTGAASSGTMMRSPGYALYLWERTA